MRLIDPGVGELSDRLTILALKILFGAEAGKDVAHFKREQASILAKMRSRDLNGAWFEPYTELAAVNAVLWHDEEALRVYRKNVQEGPEGVLLGLAARTAFRIQALNDRRADLIAAINKATGDGDGPEKVFSS